MPEYKCTKDADCPHRWMGKCMDARILCDHRKEMLKQPRTDAEIMAAMIYGA